MLNSVKSSVHQCDFLFLQSQQPVIVTGSDLVGPACNWTIEYLADNIGNGLYKVYSSANGKFKYFDDKKVPHNKGFKPPTSQKDMTFPEFVKLLRKKKPTDEEL